MLLFAWSRYRGLNIRFRLQDHARFVLLGVLLFGVNYVLAYHAQIYITSALTAIAFSTMVWMNIINTRIFFGVRAGRRVIFGALLGIAGIFTIFAPQVGEFALTDAIFYGSVLAVGGAVLASFGNMVSQAAQKRDLPVIQTNAWGMLYGTVFSTAIAANEGDSFNFDWSLGYVTSLAYLTLFG